MRTKLHVSEKDILKAQKWLANLGSSVRPTGKWSIGMQTAVYSFQRKYSLLITGELDEATWKQLKKENSFPKRLMRKFKQKQGESR